MGIREDMKSGTYKRVYLLFGDDEYLRKSREQALFRAAKGEDTMNASVLSGAEISLSEVRSFTDTVPFFADRRVLLLTDTGLFKANSEEFSDWIETLPETAVVIFSETEVDKRNKLYKAVLQIGTVEECNHPNKSALSRFILMKIGNAKKNITRDAHDFLLASIPEDYAYAENEVEKLLSYVWDKEVIDLETVKEICSVSVEDCIFQLVSAVSEVKRTEALRYYYDLLALREAPLKILTLIGREFLRLEVTREMARNRRTDEDIAAAAQIKPTMVWKSKKIAERYSEKALRSAVKRCSELDHAIKSGNLSDRTAVELLIFEMTDRKR